MKKTDLESRNLIFLSGRHAVIFAIVVAAMFAGVSQAIPVPLVNGGFETGDLTGWSNLTQGIASIDVVSSHADTSSSATGTSSWAPTDGGMFALLGTGGMGAPAVLSQTFSVAQGDVLTFDYFWDSQDSAPYNDIATGYIIAKDFLFMESVWTDPQDYWGTDWKSVNYTFAQAGTYTLQLTVTNINDDFNVSYLGIDNVVPEPATIVLLGIGGLLLRQKRRA